MILKIIVTLVLLLPAVLLHSQTVSTMTLSGTDWISVQTSSNISDAGNDLNNTVESASSQHTMDIQYTTKLLIVGLRAQPFRIEVQKSDINWDANLSVSVKRNGGTPVDGILDILSNPSSITGGTSYQSITGTSTAFFTGFGRVDNIGLQYQMSGVSLTLPADDYETVITYTMWDNN